MASFFIDFYDFFVLLADFSLFFRTPRQLLCAGLQSFRKNFSKKNPPRFFAKCGGFGRFSDNPAASPLSKAFAYSCADSETGWTSCSSSNSISGAVGITFKRR